MKVIRYNEDDFEGFVQDLINTGRIEEKEAGIAKLMLDKGYDKLSDKQKYVFDKMINENINKILLKNVNAAPLIFHGAKCLKH